jgi:hypothetical protein
MPISVVDAACGSAIRFAALRKYRYHAHRILVFPVYSVLAVLS